MSYEIKEYVEKPRTIKAIQWTGAEECQRAFEALGFGFSKSYRMDLGWTHEKLVDVKFPNGYLDMLIKEFWYIEQRDGTYASMTDDLFKARFQEA